MQDGKAPIVLVRQQMLYIHLTTPPNSSVILLRFYTSVRTPNTGVSPHHFPTFQQPFNSSSYAVDIYTRPARR
jgi:hypothetical protein